jgi:hypothetical protein
MVVCCCGGVHKTDWERVTRRSYDAEIQTDRPCVAIRARTRSAEVRVRVAVAVAVVVRLGVWGGWLTINATGSWPAIMLAFPMFCLSFAS